MQVYKTKTLFLSGIILLIHLISNGRTQDDGKA